MNPWRVEKNAVIPGLDNGPVCFVFGLVDALPDMLEIDHDMLS